MLPVPHPPFPLTIRPATLQDVAFMDELQKKNGRALGWFPTKQFEGYVALGGALVAESGGARVGYLLGRDTYGGQDDVGAIYQLAVDPERRRCGVGASLVRAALARVAYGCRLVGCWCAQDLAANEFWRDLGFVPLAFRTGSRRKGAGATPRTHVYWQRRVNEGDDCGWWYPYQTRNGAIRENRLVFPIPPGQDWRGELPVVLPEDARAPGGLLEAAPAKRKRAAKPSAPALPSLPALSPTTAALHGKVAVLVGGGRFRYVNRPRPEPMSPTFAPPPPPPPPVPEAPQPAAKRMAAHEKRAVMFCRELRDRYLEQVNHPDHQHLLEPAPRYAVGRLPPPAPAEVRRLEAKVKLLPAA